MNGCAIPYTPIAVDFLKTRQCPRVKFFFLTHAFVDQTCGLSHSWSMPIYCSALSRKILLSKFSIRPDVVHSLELNVQHSISLCNNEEDCIKVTLVDSNYCPGSVMFFFEGYFGRILYTGNFRFNEASLSRSLLPNLLRISVDVLYLDNTYCNSKCVFPTKESALEIVKEIVAKHDKGKILIALKAFGKEELLICLSKYFKEKIRVNDDRIKVFEILNEDKNFTSNNFASSMIDVVPFSDIFQKANYDVALTEPSVCIVPTGLFTALGYNPFENQSNIFVVPYSNHSSYMELIKFVSFVHPKSIVPINKPVNDPVSGALMDRNNIDCFQEYLDRSPMHHYHIPQSVLKVMNQSAVPKVKRSTKTSAKKTRKQSAPIFAGSCDSGGNGAYKMNDSTRRASSYVGPSIFEGLATLSRPSVNHCSNPLRRISLTTPQPVKILKRWKSVGSLTPVHEQALAHSYQQNNFIDLSLPPMVANINFYQASNLVRSHRARLCLPEQCETVCGPRNIPDSYPCSSSNGRVQLERASDLHRETLGSSSAFEHNEKKVGQFNLIPNKLQSFQQTKCDYNICRRAVPDSQIYSCHVPDDQKISSVSEKNSRNEGSVSSSNLMKRTEKKVDESYSTNELPPKKKWCNKFNTSQRVGDDSHENKSKPPPRRRMGTTANPVDVCLVSTAKVPTTYMTSSSNLTVLGGFNPKIASSTKSPVQRNCGHSMKLMCINGGVIPVTNLCSPIDLSMSKD